MTDLIFECLPDGSLRTGLRWAPANLGVQWLDVSLYDNDFAPGSFLGIGPLSADASGLLQDGFLPGAWHYVRVNTLTPEGWYPSPTMTFLTPQGCPFGAPPLTALPQPAGCAPLLADRLGGCVWTARPDYAGYALGETVHFCYGVSQPAEILIVVSKPDGSSLIVLDGFVAATGACIGPFQAAEPLGLRSVRMFGGPSKQLIAETHFYVQ